MKLLVIVAVADLLIVNGALVWLVWLRAGKNEISTTNESANVPEAVTKDECGVVCKNFVNGAIAEALASSSANSSVAVTKPQPTLKQAKSGVVKPTAIKIKQVNYVTVPGIGSTMLNDWVDLPGTDFYFDPGDYPGVKEVYFESSMRLFNGNGMAYVRLFDVTHGIGVQGSETSTNSQMSVLVTSGKVSFWSGKNVIRAQIKSLTADTAIFDSGRLRITTEN